MMTDKRRAGLRQAYCSRYVHFTEGHRGTALNPDGKTIPGAWRVFHVPVCGTQSRLTHVDPSMGPAEGEPCPKCHEEVYGVKPARKKGQGGPVEAPEQPLLFEVSP